MSLAPKTKIEARGRLRTLAATIEKTPHYPDLEKVLPSEIKRISPKPKFNMTTFGTAAPGCGTVACIAGFAALEAVGARKYKKLSVEEIQEIATEYLGLDRDTGDALFFMYNEFRPRGKSLDEITPKEAAEVIRCVAQTL